MRTPALALLVMLLPTAVRPIGSKEPKQELSSPVPPTCRQLLLVRTPSWVASHGVLQRYERTDDSGWSTMGSPVPVDVGRAGLGWGRGLHDETNGGPSKKEGDGRSPAGAFRLSLVFGAAPTLPDDARGFPYLQARSTTYCVEDIRSDHYNEIVDSDDVTPSSWERWSPLLRADGLFAWGVVISQNAPDVQQGLGSCVFLHIWRGPGRPTSGCTAMPAAELEEIVRWLDARFDPVIVQLPDPAFEHLRAEWGLP